MYLLDTNHCSKLIDKDPLICARLEKLGSTPVATCAIVRGELRFMVEKSNRKSENEAKVSAFLNDIEIFPVDDRAADLYGKIKELVISKYGPATMKSTRRVKLKDIGLTDNDLWIAAVAIDKGFTVVSIDPDFSRIKAAFTDLNHETWL